VNQLGKWRLEFEVKERAGPPQLPLNLEQDLVHRRFLGCSLSLAAPYETLAVRYGD